MITETKRVLKIERLFKIVTEVRFKVEQGDQSDTPFTMRLHHLSRMNLRYELPLESPQGLLCNKAASVASIS